MKRTDPVTKEVTDHNSLYHTLREVLPKKGTAILGLRYISKDSKTRINNILIGADMVSFAQRKGIPVKSREELDKLNSVDYREGYFTFSNNGTVGIEGIQMNNRVPGVTATIFVLKWVASITYKGVNYQVKEVPKRSAYAFVTQVGNGFTKVQMPDRTKYICRANFGQKGDKVSYCPNRKTFMNLVTREVLDEEYFFKKGSLEYLSMKKALNTDTAAQKGVQKPIPYYPPIKEGAQMVTGKPIGVVASGAGGRSLLKEEMEQRRGKGNVYWRGMGMGEGKYKTL